MLELSTSASLLSHGRYDVMVAGAGLAGAATALALQRNGIRTVLLDRACAPGWKIGETLAPAAAYELRTLGLGAQLDQGSHLPTAGLLSSWGSSALGSTDFVRNPYGCGYQVDRAALESALLQAARQAGACVLQGVGVQGISKDQAGWQVATSHGFVKTGFLVDASGRSCIVARWLGIRRHAVDRLVAIYLLSSPSLAREPDTRTLVEASEGGWWYAAVLPSREQVLSFQTDSDLIRGRCWQQPGWLLGVLAGTHHVRRRHAVSAPGNHDIALTAANSCRLQTFGGNGWLAVGDAAFARDPLSGQGMTWALDSACSAVETILRGGTTAMRDYLEATESAWYRFLENRHRYYAAERRWPDSVFWCRRGVIG